MGLFSSLTRPAWERASGRAEKAEKSGDLAAAWRELGVALESAPEGERANLEARRQAVSTKLYEAHVRAGRAADEAGDLAQALDRWELARRFAPDDASKNEAEDALRVLAAERLKAEEAAEAPPEVPEPTEDEVFTMLLGNMDEDLADRYESEGPAFRLAFVALQRGVPEEAVGPLTTLAEGSQNPVVHYELGASLLALERWEAAMSAFERAEELDPTWNAPRLGAARAAWALERWDVAEAVLQRAVDQGQEDVRVLASVAMHALLTKEPEAGLDATEVALEVDPQDREAMLLRGQLLELAERPREAIECYESVVERYWQYNAETDVLQFDREAGLLAARLYARRRLRPERAEELLRAAVHVTPATARWSLELELAEVLVNSERTDEANEILREVQTHIPEDDLFGRLRAAHLANDQDALGRLTPELDAGTRQRWNAWLSRHSG